MGGNPKDLQHFFVAGISYKKSDSATRSRYSINREQYAWILDTARQNGISEVFILSTCNRTEIYGLAHEITQLVSLLCEATGEPSALFYSIAYLHRGKEAVQHLFSVAAGLDSQILGDYEIVGQLKTAFKFSKEKQCTGPFLERLYNQALQTSKQVKNKTALSSGTVSVSFAAVQYIKDAVPEAASRNILLIGTGKIGSNTCKNLIDYLGCNNIVLMNRSFEKARDLADALHIEAMGLDKMEAAISDADIIIVAAGAESPLIGKWHIKDHKPQWIIDLSIPNNVDPEVAGIPGKQLLNVDQLSRQNDATIQMRTAEIPKALELIGEQMTDFFDWCSMRKQLVVLGVVKSKLEEIHDGATFTGAGDPQQRIQKVLNSMAAKMRIRNQRGCQYLEAINDFIGFGIN